MAGNTTIADPCDSNFDDWLELYNASDVTIDLSGMYLADDTTMYLIPGGVTIDAGGYLLFWTDDESGQGDTHTNFKLGKSGDDITLFDTDGTTVLESIIGFETQTDDVSYGRYPDGTNNWDFCSTPTPEATNSPHVP